MVGGRLRLVGIDVDGFGPHALRAIAIAIAITNALDNNADLATLQVWVGRANVSTTRMNDRRYANPISSKSARRARSAATFKSVL